MTRCSANQCKKKQWCERYQLYLRSLQSQKAQEIMPWEFTIFTAGLNVSKHEEAKLRQFIDNCEYFVPTKQYIIKEKLEKLDTFYKN